MTVDNAEYGMERMSIENAILEPAIETLLTPNHPYLETIGPVAREIRSGRIPVTRAYDDQLPFTATAFTMKDGHPQAAITVDSRSAIPLYKKVPHLFASDLLRSMVTIGATKQNPHLSSRAAIRAGMIAQSEYLSRPPPIPEDPVEAKFDPTLYFKDQPRYHERLHLGLIGFYTGDIDYDSLKAAAMNVFGSAEKVEQFLKMHYENARFNPTTRANVLNKIMATSIDREIIDERLEKAIRLGNPHVDLNTPDAGVLSDLERTTTLSRALVEAFRGPVVNEEFRVDG